MQPRPVGKKSSSHFGFICFRTKFIKKINSVSNIFSVPTSCFCRRMVRPAVSVGFKEATSLLIGWLMKAGSQPLVANDVDVNVDVDFRFDRIRRKKNSSNRLRSQTFEFFHSNVNAINILPIQGHIWTTNFESTAFTFFHSEQLAKPQNPELLRCSLLLWLNEVEWNLSVLEKLESPCSLLPRAWVSFPPALIIN